jgi:hypothetical protein
MPDVVECQLSQAREAQLNISTAQFSGAFVLNFVTGAQVRGTYKCAIKKERID